MCLLKKDNVQLKPTIITDHKEKETPKEKDLPFQQYPK